MLKKMDHTAYMKKVKKLSTEALLFIIEDAQGAIKACPDNPNNGYYQDEIHYCCMELTRRKRETPKGKTIVVDE